MSQSPQNSDMDKPSSPNTTDHKAFQVRVHAQYVKDLSLETPAPPPDKDSGMGPAHIEMSIDVHAESRKNPAHSAEVTLKILARAKHKDTVLFILELSYAGIFELINIPPEETEAVFLIEAPRQLFPFARRLVADLTREGGFPPLLIDPIDFTALYLSHRDKAKSEGTTTQSYTH